MVRAVFDSVPVTPVMSKLFQLPDSALVSVELVSRMNPELPVVLIDCTVASETKPWFSVRVPVAPV